MLTIPTVKDNLARYMDAGFPILFIHTFEDIKVDRYIADAAGRREVVEWNGSCGFSDFKTKVPFINNQGLEDTLILLNRGKELDRKIIVIKDATALLDPDAPTKSEKVISLLKEIARKIREEIIDASVIIVSHKMKVPSELEKLTTILELDLPDSDEINKIVRQFISDNGIDISVNDKLIDDMAVSFRGLSEYEIEDILRLAISEDGELTSKALRLIHDQKQQMILKSGILEMVPLEISVNDIGGLDNLKEWLKNKAYVFKRLSEAKDFGVPTPKGVLIAGIPGCAKSLSAKATGMLFDVPLLRLDMGRLMGKYVGESEDNMRRAIQLAEAISPCVLWVDELEKAFAGTGSGGGSEVTTRLFGYFLTWMQEKKSPTCVVATANDISGLPPELKRKGRFDEIFYVDLPNPDEREKIFEIHIGKRRKQDLPDIDLNALVTASDGYSGADIEGVVGESIERAFVKGQDRLTTEEILDCMSKTFSLSEIMKDQINNLHQQYEGGKFKKASR